MSDRIKKLFKDNKKKLITFTTGGDPNLKTSIKIIDLILKNKIDMIEIGMPFSDLWQMVQLFSYRVAELLKMVLL